MHGAHLNNIGISLDLIGGAIAGLSIGLGVPTGKVNLVTAGSVIGCGFAVVGLVCNIIGNRLIKDGGSKLKNLEFSGNGMRFKF